MRRSVHILYAMIISVLLLTCKEEENKFGKFTDKRDNKTYLTVKAGDAIWMLENLQYGAVVYSYQHALYACPEGWSLPDADDWIKLANHFGGYLNVDTPVGDPFKSYASMIQDKVFNADAGIRYWASTPAWEDEPQIKSYAMYFESGNQQVVLQSGFVTNQTYCRCVKKEHQDNDDFLQFTRSGNFYRFDYYRIDSKLNTHADVLAIMIHNKLDNGLLDRSLFTLKLPANPVTPDNPIVVTQATLNHQTLDVIWDENSFHNFSAPAFFTVTITQYDGQTVEGTFTGQTGDHVSLSDGEFHFTVKEN